MWASNLLLKEFHWLGYLSVSTHYVIIAMVKLHRFVQYPWVSRQLHSVGQHECYSDPGSHLLPHQFLLLQHWKQKMGVQWKWYNNFPTEVWANLWLWQSLKIGSATTGIIEIINVRKQHLSNHSSRENGWHYCHNTTGFWHHYFCGEARGEMEVQLLLVKTDIFIYFMDLTCCLLL